MVEKMLAHIQLSSVTSFIYGRSHALIVIPLILNGLAQVPVRVEAFLP